MGGLKPQDPVIGSTEQPKKKPRGNPNLRKGVKNPYYSSGESDSNTTQQTQKPMAEETTNNESSDVSGEKKIIPDDNFSDEIPNKEFIPLEGEARTKDYGAINNTQNPNTATTNNPVSGPGTATDTTNTGHVPTGDPTNPLGTPTAPLPGEEVRTKAEQAVKIALNLYDKLHGVGRHLAKTSEAELNDLHMSGKINLKHELPLGTGKISIVDFVNQLNAEIDENVVVSKEFKEEITPPLTRIAIKYNWGLSDEWFVGALLLEDISTKAAVLYSMKSTCNLILDSCMRMEKEQKEGKKPKDPPADTTETNNPSVSPTTNGPDIQDVHWQDIPSAD